MQPLGESLIYTAKMIYERGHRYVPVPFSQSEFVDEARFTLDHVHGPIGFGSYARECFVGFLGNRMTGKWNGVSANPCLNSMHRDLLVWVNDLSEGNREMLRVAVGFIATGGVCPPFFMNINDLFRPVFVERGFALDRWDANVITAMEREENAAKQSKIALEASLAATTKEIDEEILKEMHPIFFESSPEPVVAKAQGGKLIQYKPDQQVRILKNRTPGKAAMFDIETISPPYDSIAAGKIGPYYFKRSKKPSPVFQID